MTDETKKLFDAPWKPEEYEHGHGAWILRKSDGFLLAENMAGQDANRLARLPELYDKLMEAKNEIFIILSEGALGKSEVDYLAFFNEIQELLNKVRDGK